MKRREVMSALGAALTGGWHTRGWAQSGRIVIGQSAALSGPAAELGRQFKQGADVCFEFSMHWLSGRCASPSA